MEALDAGLSTPPDKKEEMMKKAYKYAKKRTFANWVESFLKDLKQAYNKTNNAMARYIYLGLSTEAVKMGHEKVESTALNIGHCVSDFEHKNRCLVLIDHEALPRKQFGRGEM
jgi:trehalose-6-phosphate synthase